jgi:hypothetical protein
MSSGDDPGSVRDPATPEGTGTPGGTTRSPADAPAQRGRRGRRGAGNMLPGRERRQFGLERLVVRLVATAGVIGIGVALGAILVSSKVQGWITGLVVAAVSVVLAAILWSSRQL